MFESGPVLLDYLIIISALVFYSSVTFTFRKLSISDRKEAMEMGILKRYPILKYPLIIFLTLSVMRLIQLKIDHEKEIVAIRNAET